MDNKLPGHSCTLQASVMLAGPGHSLPPNAASIFRSLKLDLVPPPQVIEHSPTTQSPHSQST